MASNLPLSKSNGSSIKLPKAQGPLRMSLTPPFSKILIANRGEIALRIMRTCREMGIQTVAVYSEADRGARHVHYADEALAIGGNSARESYLVKEKIIQAAKKTKAEAVHPGYGFLSENAEFCRMCQAESLVFIGPDPGAMEKMGLKIDARRLMQQHGVPLIPGAELPMADDPQAALAVAQGIGFPVMVKASAGGGGKGMRIVHREADFAGALRGATSEAFSSFGDNTVYLEKYVQSPHHIEIQILADGHGSTVFLFERECSIQRRHQKVIEECPSPFIDDDLRQRMGQTAVNAAQAVDYRNAGTVEFIVDDRKNFYFLEMNTRLQVEHPITELVTGKDLVRLQITIAAGEPLPFKQADLSIRGAAIECRVYAEDPENNFMPSPGLIRHLEIPSGPGIRDDSGVFEGYEIPIYYDPLISKLSAWGETRDLAIARMIRALSEYRISGVKTNIAFLRQILRHPVFLGGIYDTGFIPRHCPPETQASPNEEMETIAIAAAAIFQQLKSNVQATNGSNVSADSGPKDRWKEHGRMRVFNSRLR
jgi:acetyl-CoA carboxylase, biotin carboxylase subunit